jgi:hypothetical protein
MLHLVRDLWIEGRMELHPGTALQDVDATMAASAGLLFVTYDLNPNPEHTVGGLLRIDLV